MAEAHLSEQLALEGPRRRRFDSLKTWRTNHEDDV